MEPLIIPWMTPEETEQLLQQLRKRPEDKGDKRATATPTPLAPKAPAQLQKIDVASLNMQTL